MAQTQREQLKETEKQQTKRLNFNFGKNESATEKGQECMYCGAACSSTAQICPECGMSLMGDKSTFCGAHLAPGDTNCVSCGCSTDGIE